ncbi:MAG TPA: hypothetical protein VFH80_22835 [Solirubrobacteraceae bacterium]|nr:hypothetical protein [Solirubrobacteraceae bacterium]
MARQPGNRPGLTSGRDALYRAEGDRTVGQGRRGIIWAVAVACLTGAACGGAGAQVEAPAPVFARTVVLAPIGGKVLIEPPGSSAFARLTARRSVPLGTTVDTTAGTVSLTSANPNPGSGPAQQTGRFFRGIFRIEQSRYAGGLVNLVIRDNLSRSTCGTGAARGAAVNPKVLGLLRGTAKGRFRTTGRFAAATVRGTDWGVQNRCDGTLTVVRSGVVAVSDFRLHKTVIVRAGQTYLAKG